GGAERAALREHGIDQPGSAVVHERAARAREGVIRSGDGEENEKQIADDEGHHHRKDEAPKWRASAPAQQDHRWCQDHEVIGEVGAVEPRGPKPTWLSAPPVAARLAAK